MNTETKQKAFTLVELLVVISIIAILSGLILFSVTEYINKSKDSNISANLVILIPAGEVYYNAQEDSSGNGYSGFCGSDVARNAKNQMPTNLNSNCNDPKGFCCAVDGNNQAWAACVQEFAASASAYCVDSRGVKKDVTNSYCTEQIGRGVAFNCQ